MKLNSYHNPIFDSLIRTLNRSLDWAKLQRCRVTLVQVETFPPPIVVASFASRMEAEYAKSILDAAGIFSLVSADDAGGMEIPIARSSYLAVRESDFDRARELLSASQAPCDPDELDAAALSGEPPAE